MRLGKEAMRRQLDMPLDDALDYLRAQLSLAMSTEDIVEGVTRLLREARAAVERPLMSTEETVVETSLLRPLVEDLHARREQIRLGGGEEKIAEQHERDKLTARERIALLIDEGTFVELGIHGKPHFSQRAMDGVDAPADGVITGYGKVDGRLTAVCAYDFTVMAGSMGMTGELKVTRLRELALTKRMPFVWLLDSAGARVQEAAGAMFAGSGHLFREEVVMSGVIPQVAALMGPCAAGTAYIPGLADFVPMVKGRGSMALAGPHLVRAAVGRGRHPGGTGRLARALPQVGRRRHGGGQRRGVHRADQAVPLLHAPELRTALAGAAPAQRPDRPARGGRCSTSCPKSNRKPYDMYEVIRRIVDDGEYFDMKGQWAKTIITCFARFGGRPVGIVANQPKQLGGILDNDSADKAARFVNLCNAFGDPARLHPGRARLHGRHEGRGRRHHPPRRQDAPRGRQRDGARRSRSSRARRTARATT